MKDIQTHLSVGFNNEAQCHVTQQYPLLGCLCLFPNSHTPNAEPCNLSTNPPDLNPKKISSPPPFLNSIIWANATSQVFFHGFKCTYFLGCLDQIQNCWSNAIYGWISAQLICPLSFFG